MNTRRTMVVASGPWMSGDRAVLGLTLVCRDTVTDVSRVCVPAYLRLYSIYKDYNLYLYRTVYTRRCTSLYSSRG